MMTGKEVQIEVLNYSDGEIIDYPLVLLECKAVLSESQSLECTAQLSANDARDYKPITFECENDAVLVETGSDCRSWPVIHGAFKALVRLNAGKNHVKFKSRINGRYTEQDFSLTYVPSKLKRFVRVVYIKCCDSDGSFQVPPGVVNDVDSATKKLAFNARLLQTFTAQDMNQHGFGHKTFRLDEDSEGKPLISIFTSTVTSAEALEMTGGQLYDRFAKELANSNLYDPLCKFWAFMSCTRYQPPPPEEFDDKDIFSYVKAHTALGGGTLALFGTGNLHTWASDVGELVSCFTDTKIIDRRCLFDDSSRRGSYWANYATGLGASMHELGHCFNLAHTPGGIMGRGFDDFNCVFSLWKNPPPATCKETGFGATGDMKEITDSKASSITEDDTSQQINEKTKPIVKDLADSPPKGLLQDKEGLGTHENKLVDWTRNSTKYAMPGDWSHGAKWYRSSAVILHHHKWFNNCNDDGDDNDDDESANQPIVHWSQQFYGPVGNMSDRYNCNNTCFNDNMWLADNNAVLSGYVIHADAYVNGIQSIGRKVEIEDNVEKVVEIFSEPRGSQVGHKYVFKIDQPDEYMTAIDVRAGSWIDALRIHTNYKSSILMGGVGGCMSRFKPSEEQRIVGLFGRAGDFVGSLGIFLESSNSSATTNDTDENLIIAAPNGLRLIELHDEKHEEVYQHWEFLEASPPTQFALNRNDIIEQQARIVVMDSLGNIHSSGPFCDSDEIFSPAKPSPGAQAEEKVENSKTSPNNEMEDDDVGDASFGRKANEDDIERKIENETTKNEKNFPEKRPHEKNGQENENFENTEMETNKKTSNEMNTKEEQKLQSEEVEIEGTTQNDKSDGNEEQISETRHTKQTELEKETDSQNDVRETELQKTKRRRPKNQCKGGEETTTRYY